MPEYCSYPSSSVLRYREEQARKVAAEQAARAADADRTFRERRAALLPGVQRGSVDAMRDFVELLAQRHHIKIEIPASMPADVSAYAHVPWGVVVPPVTDEESFAVVLHEMGHCLSERCQGGAHQPDPTERRWHHCVECERLAWAKAMELAPFSREMFSRLQSSLGSYRETTAAPDAAAQAADRLRSNLTYCELVQGRATMQARIDWLNQMKRDLDPRPHYTGQLLRLKLRLDAAMGANK